MHIKDYDSFSLSELKSCLMYTDPAPGIGDLGN